MHKSIPFNSPIVDAWEIDDVVPQFSRTLKPYLLHCANSAVRAGIIFA